jgi:hypothetical protein
MALHATISLDKRFPLPLLENWQRWARKVSLELEPFLPGGNDSEDGDQDTLGWHGNPEAVITFDAQGQTFLQAVILRSWQGINLPRQWDDPDKADPDLGEQLYQFATNIKQALGIWQKGKYYSPVGIDRLTCNPALKRAWHLFNFLDHMIWFL